MHGTSIHRNALIISTMFIMGCGFLSTPKVSMAAKTASAAAKQESIARPSVANASNNDIYTLHHRVVPGILFSDKGSLMFNDLFSGNTGPFLAMTESALGRSYASGIKFTSEHRTDVDIVFISFPAPYDEPNCIHAALVKSAGTFRYIMLETGNKTGSATLLCEWLPQPRHVSYGEKNYRDLTSFRTELSDILKKPAPEE
jgi:hypothetical protein